MRHLSVPSAQTQHWLDICRTHNWSSNEAGVTRLEDGRNALPLNDSAPLESDQVWKSNPHLEIEIQPKGPTHWLDHIDEGLVDAHREDWPRSYEIQGDILIVKIEEVVWEYGELIADAMTEIVRLFQIYGLVFQIALLQYLIGPYFLFSFLENWRFLVFWSLRHLLLSCQEKQFSAPSLLRPWSPLRQEF